MRIRNFALAALVLVMACASGRKTDYPLLRQYPGELPAEPAASPAKPKPKKHLHLEVPEGWKDVTETFTSIEGTVVVYARPKDGLALIAVNASMAVKGEKMSDTLARISAQLGDAKIVTNVESGDGRGSFDWTGEKDVAGHVIVITLKDAPGINFAFLGFGSTKTMDDLKKTMGDLVDSAEISEK